MPQERHAPGKANDNDIAPGKANQNAPGKANDNDIAPGKACPRKGES